MMVRTSKDNQGRRGFSLLELLAVMSIMAMLTTLAVTSYFSAIRSMTRRSATKHLVNTFILARQRACMEGARVSVIIFNEVTGEKDTDVTPSYVMCKEIGQLTFLNLPKLVDEFTEIDRMFGTKGYGDNYKGSMKLYNLTEGKWSHVYPWVVPYQLNSRYSASGNPHMTDSEQSMGYSLNVFAFKINPNVQNSNGEPNWNVGDAYGIEVAPAGSLPRNFWFSTLQDSVTKVITVTFEPDGTATTADNTITISETQPPKFKNSITVASDGSINYNEDWN